jgi:hypothetical protein
MRVLAKGWAKLGLLLCFLMAYSSAAGPGEQTQFPAFEAIRAQSSSRWLRDPQSVEWRPMGPTASVTEPAVTLATPAESLDFAICEGPSWQLNPAIAWNSDRDEFLVVWEDNRNGQDFDIYGQLVGDDGHLLGDNRPLVLSEHDQAVPDVFYSPVDGSYVLLWHHRQPGRFVIKGQRISTSLDPLGTPFDIPSPNEGEQWIPGCAYDGADNELLVAWEDMTTADILAQRIASDGTVLGGTITVASWPESQWAPPLVVFNSAQGEYLVVWDALADADIYGQIVATDGTLRGANLIISLAPGKQFASDAEYGQSSDEYLVVWTDERAMPKRGSDIYAQRLSAEGVLIGEELIVSGASEWQRDCRAAYDPGHDEYLMVWWDGRSPGMANDIYGQRLSLTGAPLGPSLVISSAPSDQMQPAVARAGSSDQILIAWQDWTAHYGETGNPDVRGLLYGPPRFALWFPKVAAAELAFAFSNMSAAP